MGLIHCNLRVLMAERRLNIQNVKDQTSLSRTTISNLVNNYGSGIQFDTLKQLCNLLNCQPGDLFTYIDISTNFEVTTDKPTITTERDTTSDEDKKSCISGIQVNLDIHLNLVHEGDLHELNFGIELNYGLNEEEVINEFQVGINQNFNYELKQLKLIPHAEDFVRLELEDFLIEWGRNHLFEGAEIGETLIKIISYYVIKD